MKKNGFSLLNYAGSLLIDHLFALLISLVIINVLNFFSNDGIPVLRLILCASVYFVICYVDFWHKGNADRNRIRLGVIPNNKIRAVFAGLIAAIPGFMLSVIALLTEIGAASFLDVFTVDIFTTLNRLWHLPLGTLYEFVNTAPVLNLIIPLFLPIAAEIGYICGMYEITLKKYFIYTNESEED